MHVYVCEATYECEKQLRSYLLLTSTCTDDNDDADDDNDPEEKTHTPTISHLILYTNVWSIRWGSQRLYYDQFYSDAIPFLFDYILSFFEATRNPPMSYFLRTEMDWFRQTSAKWKCFFILTQESN